MRVDRFLWACVILAILLLCGYELAHCQIIPASELRMTAGTPYTVAGRYQIMINSATGRITCTTPTGTDCSPTAGSIAWGAITDVPATFPPSAHTHNAGDINGGILGPLYGGTGFNGAPADIILVGNGTTYDQRSLCTGYVKYSLTTHLLTCDAGTGGSFTGGTLSTKLTLAPSTLTGAGLNLGTGSVTPTSGLATGDLWGDAAWELNWWDGANQRTAERRDHKGQPNGYAPLDSGGLVPVGNLPVGSTGVNVTGNAQQYAGFCTGTASSSATLSIPPFGTANASSCSSTTTANELPMSWSGTLRNLQVKAGTAGRLSTSGVVTLYKNGVATGITCTIGTGTICSDVTHTSTVNVGDTVGVRMTTQSTETLANVRVTFEDYGGGTGFNYRGTWTASTIYNPYDIVSYNGTTYERSGPTFTSAGTFNAANWNVWAAGATGGIPIGGTTGQVLAKNSATDYDVGWVTGGGGGGSGTVTSVALTAPAQFSVTGSPVTTSGTLALTWATQAANIVFAGPTSGGAATPGFRALVAADIPTLNQSTTGNAATATALAANGTNCAAGNYPLGVDASGNAENCTAAGGGGGTVTSFSAGNLSPLFTTSVATATTTPALTFALSNATAHTFYGNNTGSTGAPAFVGITAADVPTLNQNTTGTAAALAANGTNCTANQFNKGVDASGNAESCAALVSGDIPNNAANTTGTSANVTGTVAIGNGGTGQTAKTAAFNALSPLTTLGDVAYHDGTNSVRLAGNTVATRKFLRQLGTGAVSAAPAWDTILAADIPTLNQSTTGTAANVTGIVAEANGGTGAANTTGAAGHYLRSNATHYVDSAIQAGDVPTLNQSTTANAGTATALAANGTNCSAGSVGAGVDASGNEEGCTATVTPTAHNLLSTAHGDTTAATVSRGALITGQTATPKWQLLAAGSASQCLQMDASGVDIIWGACATGGSGSPGGADTQVQFNDAGVFGGDTGLTWDKANDILTVGPAVTNYQTWAWATQTANRTVTWPDSVGPGFPNMGAGGNVSYLPPATQSGGGGIINETQATIPAPTTPVLTVANTGGTLTNTVVAAPTAGPTLTVSNTGGSITNASATTVFVKSTYNTTAVGETTASPEVSIVVNAANGCLAASTTCSVIVTAPPLFRAENITGYTIYSSITTGTEKQQLVSGACFNINTNCVIGVVGAGASPPVANTAGGTTVYVRTTLVNAFGETTESPETAVNLNATNGCNAASVTCSVTVTAPTLTGNATGYTVYSGTAPSTDRQQAASNACINVTANCVIQAVGAFGNASPPTYNTASDGAIVAPTWIGSTGVGAVVMANGAISNPCKISGIVYIDQNNSCGWPGADIGAWVNNGYAGCPATGCYIVIGPGNYNQSTTISDVNGHPLYIQCTDGPAGLGNPIYGATTINWQPYTDVAFSLVASGSSMKGCTLVGQGTGSAIGIISQGATGYYEHNDIHGFDVGFQWGSGAYIQTFTHNLIHDNTTHDLYAPAGLGNGFGENISFVGGAIYSKGTGFNTASVQFSSPSVVNFTGVSFDQVGVTIDATGSTFNCQGCHFENPNATTNSDFITCTANTNTDTMISLVGGDISDDFAGSRTELVKLNGPCRFAAHGGRFKAFQTEAQFVNTTNASSEVYINGSLLANSTNPYGGNCGNSFALIGGAGQTQSRFFFGPCTNPYQMQYNAGITLNTITSSLVGVAVAGAAWVETEDTVGNKANKGGLYTGLGSSFNGDTEIVAASAAINTTETVLVKTAALPASRLVVGTHVIVTLVGTCTSTAANTSTFTLRWGTAGTTADGILSQLVTGAAATTGTAIPFKAIVDVVIRTTGASATGYAALSLENQGVTGISSAATGSQIISGATTAINTTTANAILSATYKSAATTTTSTFQIAGIKFINQ